MQTPHQKKSFRGFQNLYLVYTEKVLPVSLYKTRLKSMGKLTDYSEAEIPQKGNKTYGEVGNMTQLKKLIKSPETEPKEIEAYEFNMLNEL